MKRWKDDPLLDDDPADTAARAWMRSLLAQNTVISSTIEGAMIRAFRCGYLIAKKQAAEAVEKGSSIDGD